MPAAWAASSASATWPSSATARSGGSGPSRSIRLLQVAALDQPHRDDQLAVLLAGVVDRHDAGWSSRAASRDSRRKRSRNPSSLGQLAGDHLERHRPVEGQLGRPVDDPHPARGRSARRAGIRRGSSRWRGLPRGGYTAAHDEGPSARRGPSRWRRRRVASARTGCQAITGPIVPTPPLSSEKPSASSRGGRWRRRSRRATPRSSAATKAATLRPSEEKTELVFEPSASSAQLAGPVRADPLDPEALVAAEEQQRGRSARRLRRRPSRRRRPAPAPCVPLRRIV